MGLEMFLSLPDVELPHYLVQPLLHLVDCQRGTVKIKKEHLAIKPLIPVILGLPSEPGMDKLPSVDDDLLDTVFLTKIIGAGLVMGEFGDQLKEINDPAVFKLAFLSFILCHLLCPNSNAHIKESIYSLKSKIESIQKAGWCSYIYDQLMIAIREYKHNCSSWKKGSKNRSFVRGCMYILAVIHLDVLDTPEKPDTGYPRILHIKNNHFRQMKNHQFEFLLVKDTVYANVIANLEQEQEVQPVVITSGARESDDVQGSPAEAQASDVCDGDEARGSSLLCEHVPVMEKKLASAAPRELMASSAVGNEIRKESTTALVEQIERQMSCTQIGRNTDMEVDVSLQNPAVSQVQDGPDKEESEGVRLGSKTSKLLLVHADQQPGMEDRLVVSSKPRKGDVSSSCPKTGSMSAESDVSQDSNREQDKMVARKHAEDKPGAGGHTAPSHNDVATTDYEKHCVFASEVKDKLSDIQKCWLQSTVNHEVPEIPLYVCKMKQGLLSQMYFSVPYTRDHFSKHIRGSSGEMKISATNGGNSARMKFNISVSKSHRRLTSEKKNGKSS
ncbi:uncharacterized protein [Aegilops tauschii subsp. strangulata]|uniref:Uncharacterized protein n=2 Tax=Aegilops tauschii TaxID=37682 RepID=A0A453IPZ4_AEGTS|nr:uncharacterized protein LOC109754088 [Aegilops tauschii subsp. strangulata]XP_040243324.1 uncharacterized protein LOC109754088 [Aegilops tauschii subsp. strangulata]